MLTELENLKITVMKQFTDMQSIPFADRAKITMAKVYIHMAFQVLGVGNAIDERSTPGTVGNDKV